MKFCFTGYMLISLIVLVFMSEYTYSQRFLINNQNDNSGNIVRGDSAFFAGNYLQSISCYKKVIDKTYDEYAGLNQVQNYIGLGDIKGAVKVLKLMSDSGFYRFWIVDVDSIYQDLKLDDNYKIIRKQLERNFGAYCEENKISKPVITHQIMQLYYFDQYYQWVNAFKKRYKSAYTTLSAEELDSLQRQIFRKNIETLKLIINQQGYFWNDKIGKDATHFFWLMVQHADYDVSFQKAYLKELSEAVTKNNASALDMAYLTDRVRKNEGKKQLFGTQMVYKTIDDPKKGKILTMELWPVENPEDLDKRRKNVGLMAMKDYIKLMNQLNNRK